MTEEMVKLAAEVLAVSECEARKNSYVIPESDAVYFWSSARGGKNVIINENNEKLVAGSAVGFEKHLAFFKEGKRN